jgi:hypothetical protein
MSASFTYERGTLLAKKAQIEISMRCRSNSARFRLKTTRLLDFGQLAAAVYMLASLLCAVSSPSSELARHRPKAGAEPSRDRSLTIAALFLTAC